MREGNKVLVVDARSQDRVAHWPIARFHRGGLFDQAPMSSVTHQRAHCPKCLFKFTAPIPHSYFSQPQYGDTYAKQNLASCGADRFKRRGNGGITRDHALGLQAVTRRVSRVAG
jgi:hypothetical protein